MFAEPQDLMPQIEEDIEKAEWMSVDSFVKGDVHPVYNSILEVLKRYKCMDVSQGN